MSDARDSDFGLNPLLSRYLPHAVANVLAPPLEHVLALRRVERVYRSLSPSLAPQDFALGVLSRLGVQFVARGALDAVPREGPLVLVANHPFGGVEGLYLYSLLASLRPDVRILGNTLLSRLRQLRPALFAVDVLRGRAATRGNAMPMRAALRWVSSGGALLVFPSGEVSSFDPAMRAVTDPAWQPAIARLARLAAAQVVPAHVDGRNSSLFQVAGLVHPRLRTALLPRELLNKWGRRVVVRVGRPIAAEQLAAVGDDQALIEHLRVRVYALATEGEATGGESMGPARAQASLARAIDATDLEREIAKLDRARRLATSAGIEAWYASAAEVPGVLREIGRLRELTFRVAGEGTGRPRDLDRFDTHYEQMFLWNPATLEVIGGYRLGRTDRLLARAGVRGLYTHTLFRYDRRLPRSLGPALELGRSFVRPEYQRNFVPLMLLWRGIAAYLVQHPQYRSLFGPVSISNDYTPASRALLTGFLGARHADAVRARLVRPRHPLPAGGELRALQRAGAAAASLEAVESLVTALEPDGKGAPVLLRQYLKLGATAIAFNVDPAFSDALDVLIAVELDALDAKTLAKYMGGVGAASYRSSTLSISNSHGLS